MYHIELIKRLNKKNNMDFLCYTYWNGGETWGKETTGETQM